MALTSESQKKSYCVMEDVYGVVMAPKQELQQLQLQLHNKPAHPQLMLPDIGRACQVPLLYLLSLYYFTGFHFHCLSCLEGGVYSGIFRGLHCLLAFSILLYWNFY